MNVFVAGATGKLGRQTAAALADAGASVRAGSRHPGAAASGAVPVHFDWYDKATWSAALGDADTLVLKGLDLDDYTHETVAALIASSPRVRSAVLVSAPGVELLPDAQPRRALELAVQRSGKRWTILRANRFMQNFDEDERVLAEALRNRGELHAPTGDAEVSFVDTRDIAAAAVAALTGDHGGREYTVTGPDPRSFGDVAKTIGAASGRAVEHVDGTLAEHREHMRGQDRSAAYVNHINHLFAIVRTGAQAPVRGDYETLTGRRPRTFAAYVQEVWGG